MIDFFSRLDSYMKYKGLNDNKITVETGISNGLIGKARKKGGALSLDNISKILYTYNDLSGDWLITGNGSMLKPIGLMNDNEIAEQEKEVESGITKVYTYKETGLKPIPLVNTSAVAGFGNSKFAIGEADVKDYYIVPKFRYCHVDFMIEIDGSSMYPKFNSGDVIACTILRNSSFIQWNKTHIIATEEQGILCKRIRQSSKEGYITAVSDNPDYPPFDVPMTEITGIAVVVGVIRLE